jgi:hypothetical protein
MFIEKAYIDSFLFVLRWAARILGIISVAVLLLFLFGGRESYSSITSNQAVGMLFFPFGLMIGLILGWRQEILGGAIAVGSLLGFYFVYELLINGSWPRGWWFAVFAIPGGLFFLYGILTAIRNSARLQKLNES